MIELEAGGRRVHVPVAAHACQLSTTPSEADHTARAFLRDGLRAGERCVALLPRAAADDQCANLISDGIDLDEAIHTHQLVVDMELDQRPSVGSFDPYGLAARHLTDLAWSKLAGVTRLRILVDMHWYAGPASAAALLRYEATCHAVMRQHAGRVVVLAQYRYGELPSDAVIDLLRLHPTTVVAHYIRRNPNPADPVTFMARLLNRASA